MLVRFFEAVADRLHTRRRFILGLCVAAFAVGALSIIVAAPLQELGISLEPVVAFAAASAVWSWGLYLLVLWFYPAQRKGSSEADIIDVFPGIRLILALFLCTWFLSPFLPLLRFGN